MIMKNKYFTLLSLFLLMISSYAAATDAVVLSIAGTGDSQSLLKTLAAEFKQTAPGRDIIVRIPDSVGSSGGIKALAAGKMPLARTARPLKDGEKKHSLRQFRFALSPVVIAVHPSVKGINNITSRQVSEIYSGQIRNWKQLGGAKRPIYAIDREAGDSSRSILEKHLAGFPKGKTLAKIFYTTQEAETAIAEHKFTIGFLPLSAAKSHGLKVLSVDGIKPTEGNVIKGSYKYVTPFYIVSRAKPSVVEKTFIDFLYTARAKKVIRTSGSVPTK